MKILRQMGIISGILFVGYLIEKMINTPIPGTVLGMIILLLLLVTGIIRLEMIEDVSQFLLDHLTLLFLPAGVGLISQLTIIKAKWFPMLIIIIISTALAITVTGLTIQGLRKITRGVK